MQFERNRPTFKSRNNYNERQHLKQEQKNQHQQHYHTDQLVCSTHRSLKTHSKLTAAFHFTETSRLTLQY